MSFLYPAFLLGALAAAIPIVLHLMRRDVAPEVPFSAVWLLRRSPIQRSRRRQVRDLLLLAARIAALLLLALAFARPYLSGASSLGTRIVAVDRSYSMSAPGAFDRARELARAAVNESRIGERVAIVAFDERADLVAEPGARADARSALDEVAPAFGATRYEPMVRKAIELGEGGAITLVVVSDLQQIGWEDARAITLPPGSRVEVRDAGASTGNLAVTSIAIEADRVVAGIRNDWNVVQSGRVRLLLGSRELASAPYRVAAASVAEIPIPVRVPTSGELAIAVNDPEGLGADDVRYRALGAASQRRVLVVAAGANSAGFYLSRALETEQDEQRGFVVDRATGATLSTIAPEKLEETAVVMLTSTRGLDRRAREKLAAFTNGGGGLLITAASDLEGAVLSTMFGWQPPLSVLETREGAVSLAATDLRHPIFRPFGPLLANLGQVRFDRTWHLAPDGWNVAARFSDGTPALMERRQGSGRVVLFASDLDRRWNDFPLHPSFVPFAIETIRHAAREHYEPTEFTVGSAPSGVERRPGVYYVGDKKRPVAVNVDPREGDRNRVSVDEFVARLSAETAANAPAVRLQAHQIEAGQSYWRFGLLLMLAALVAESVVGRVKVAEEAGSSKPKAGR